LFKDVKHKELAELIRARILEENPDVKMSPAMALSITKHISKKLLQILNSNIDLWAVNRDINMIFTPLETEKLCDEFRNGVGVSYDYLLKKKRLSRNAAKYLRKRHKELID